MIDPVKDDQHHPVPTSWRPYLVEIAAAFASGNYGLRGCSAEISPLGDSVRDAIASSIASYGETLTALSAEAWNAAITEWCDDHWKVYVWLDTVEAGPSDLQMTCLVYEADSAYRFEVHLVFVG